MSFEDWPELRNLAATHSRVIYMIKRVDDDVIEFVNAVGSRIVGVEPGEMEGKPSSVHWPDAERFALDDRLAVEEGKPRGPFQETHTNDDGSVVVMDTLKVPFWRGDVAYVWVEAIMLFRPADGQMQKGHSFNQAAIEQAHDRLSTAVDALQEFLASE